VKTLARPKPALSTSSSPIPAISATNLPVIKAFYMADLDFFFMPFEAALPTPSTKSHILLDCQVNANRLEPESFM